MSVYFCWGDLCLWDFLRGHMVLSFFRDLVWNLGFFLKDYLCLFNFFRFSFVCVIIIFYFIRCLPLCLSVSFSGYLYFIFLGVNCDFLFFY